MSQRVDFKEDGKSDVGTRRGLFGLAGFIAGAVIVIWLAAVLLPVVSTSDRMDLGRRACNTHERLPSPLPVLGRARRR